MITFLYWNINKKPLFKDLSTICDLYDVDIVILSEVNKNDSDVCYLLNRSSRFKYNLIEGYSTRISFFVRFPSNCFKPIHDEGGVSLRLFSPPVGEEIIIVAVHLPSKLYQDEKEQLFTAMQVSDVITRAEISYKHSRTIVVGDFNMNPFEDGICSFNGFHAVMDKSIAQKQSRKYKGHEKSFFYNPMWRIMGSEKQISGTYFDRQTRRLQYFWHTFDQVLIRPDLVDDFDEDSLEILTKFGAKSLLKNDGTPNQETTSDHLPIVFALKNRMSGMKGATS